MEESRQTHSWELKKLSHPLTVPIPDYLFAEFPKAGGCRGKKGEWDGEPSEKRLQAAASQRDNTKHPLNNAASAGMRGGGRRCGARREKREQSLLPLLPLTSPRDDLHFPTSLTNPCGRGGRGCSEQPRRPPRPLRAPGSLRGERGRAGAGRGGPGRRRGAL